MHVLWRGDTLQRLRLVSGLILFTFAGTHEAAKAELLHDFHETLLL